MFKTEEAHSKIIEILKNRGPSLPMQIAREMQMNSLFVSAFLSELINEKKIKISHLKVGGSPLYFLDEQVEQLEKFQHFLAPKEAEALMLIKQKRVLKDSEQEPAIRVALHSIKDFAGEFKKDEEIYWGYLFALESEIEDILSKTIKQPEIKKIEIEVKQEEETPQVVIPTIKKPLKEEENKKNEFQNPLVIKIPKKEKKEKEKSKFVLKVIEFINDNFKLIEERDYKAKEYNCLVQINSDLGPFICLTQAKDKKIISEADIKTLISDAQSIPLPAFLIYTENLSKKAEELAKEYSSVLKIKKMG